MRNKWKVIAEDFNSPFYRNYIWVSHNFNYPMLFKLPNFAVGIVSEKNNIKYIADFSVWQKLHDILKKRVESNYEYIDNLVEGTNKWGESFNRWSEKEIFKKDLTKIDSKRLVKLHEEFSVRQATVYASGITIVILDFQAFSFIENNLEKYLKKKVPKKLYNEYYRVFTEPAFRSFAQDQEIDLLRLTVKFWKNRQWIKDVQSNDVHEIKKIYPKFYKALSNHVKKYAWVYYVYAGPAYVEKDFLTFIQDYIKRKINPAKELLKVKHDKVSLMKLKEKYIENLNPDPFNKFILEFVGKLVWAKPRRKDYQSRSYYHLEKLQQEVARRLYLTLDQVRSMPFDVMKKSLISNKPVDTTLLSSVYDSHVCLPGDKKVNVLIGEKARDFMRKFKNKKKVSNLKKIEGSVAYKGYGKGKVRIVNSVSDIAKVQYGDIMVSVATTPAVVLAMKKALAIVTDEGGLTCHAAIISREMKKPCVIGTKFATKIFKDGDMVEVDANAGIVKLVKKAN
jgi:phosphohistidine swiveling domain-containing protein